MIKLNLIVLKKYINICIFCFIIGVLSVMYFNNKIVKDVSSFDRKFLNKRMIKTGDLFMVSYTRMSHLILDSLLGLNFVHPSISVWENGILYMVEYADYFDKYRGFIKIPFDEWIKFNRKGVILKNSLSIVDETKEKREELGRKILKIYEENKDSFNDFNGTPLNQIKMFNPFLRNYKKIEKGENVTCTEVLALIICESGIAKKTKALHKYQPSKFVGFSGFELEKDYFCDENYLIKL